MTEINNILFNLDKLLTDDKYKGLKKTFSIRIYYYVIKNLYKYKKNEMQYSEVSQRLDLIIKIEAYVDISIDYIMDILDMNPQEIDTFEPNPKERDTFEPNQYNIWDLLKKYKENITNFDINIKTIYDKYKDNTNYKDAYAKIDIVIAKIQNTKKSMTTNV